MPPVITAVLPSSFLSIVFPLVGELYEMLYQSDAPYLFDSSKFTREFGFAGTPYVEGIRTAAASYKKA